MTSSTAGVGLRRLAHVALTSTDPGRLAANYGTVVGLADAGEQPDGVIRLRTNDHHHCLELHHGGGPSLHHVAFEVADVGTARDALAHAGVEVTSIESFGYRDAIALVDPEGNQVRLVAGAEKPEPLGDRVFRPKKIGHIGVRASDVPAQAEFYTSVLGFRLSDWIGEQLAFLRCNPDHHALVFVAEPAEVRSVHHVAYEVGSFEDFARQADVLFENDVRVLWGPGRHAPSHNYFMYFNDADENRIEWVNSIKQIPEDGSYEPQVFDPTEPLTWNLWGVMPPARLLDRIGNAAKALA
jgi:catechol-2,3-dioxygenase